mmetsp:Transcript_25193/g.59411  ORF Transcript_25193/g.59411 Transcript_25193/m.59411 type:complete len:282 (+) Transcript_25193:1017-1862(+)
MRTSKSAREIDPSADSTIINYSEFCRPRPRRFRPRPHRAPLVVLFVVVLFVVVLLFLFPTSTRGLFVPVSRGVSIRPQQTAPGFDKCSCFDRTVVVRNDSAPSSQCPPTRGTGQCPCSPPGQTTARHPRPSSPPARSEPWFAWSISRCPRPVLPCWPPWSSFLPREFRAGPWLVPPATRGIFFGGSAEFAPSSSAAATTAPSSSAAIVGGGCLLRRVPWRCAPAARSGSPTGIPRRGAAPREPGSTEIHRPTCAECPGGTARILLLLLLLRRAPPIPPQTP